MTRIIPQLTPNALGLVVGKRVPPPISPIVSLRAERTTSSPMTARSGLGAESTTRETPSAGSSNSGDATPSSTAGGPAWRLPVSTGGRTASGPARPLVLPQRKVPSLAPEAPKPSKPQMSDEPQRFADRIEEFPSLPRRVEPSAATITPSPIPDAPIQKPVQRSLVGGDVDFLEDDSWLDGDEIDYSQNLFGDDDPIVAAWASLRDQPCVPATKDGERQRGAWEPETTTGTDRERRRVVQETEETTLARRLEGVTMNDGGRGGMRILAREAPVGGLSAMRRNIPHEEPAATTIQSTPPTTATEDAVSTRRRQRKSHRSRKSGGPDKQPAAGPTAEACQPPASRLAAGPVTEGRQPPASRPGKTTTVPVASQKPAKPPRGKPIDANAPSAQTIKDAKPSEASTTAAAAAAKKKRRPRGSGRGASASAPSSCKQSQS